MFNKSPRNLIGSRALIALACALVSGTSAYSQCPETPAATPVTVNNETENIPNSRQLVNGTGTVIDTTTPGQIKVNISLPNSGVTAGSYTNADISVNAQGLVTSATNGSGGGSSTTNALTAGNTSATVPNVIVPANGLIQPLPFDHTLAIATSGTEYSVPTASSNALGICTGPDRNVWFTENNQNKIGNISPTGTFTEYTVTTASSAPWGICAGPDGNLWFTENNANKIAKITTTGTITEYTIPTGSSQPTGICAGPDGNLWFTENAGNKIGKITTTGTITEYSVPTGSSAPRAICPGPDGNLWFTESAGNKIASVTTAGTVTEYTVPTGSSSPYGICAGPDGNLWFTESATNKVGKVTTAGTFTEYTVPTSSSSPDGICAGPDGQLWLCEYGTGKIASITTSGIISEYSLPTSGAGATYICVGSDGNLWLSEQSASKVATWTFTVSGTGPVLGSIAAGSNVTVSRTSTGISISAGGGGVNPTVTPVKRIFYSYPVGLATNSRTTIGALFSTSASGSIGSGAYVDGVLTNNFSTSASTGNISYQQTNGLATRYDLQPKMSVTVVPQTNTNIRHWICALHPSGSGIEASDTPTFSGGGCGFRYSTSAGDTTWQFGTTSGGGTWTFTNTGVSLTPGTKLTFSVDASDPSQITAYINGVLVATNTTNLPGATTGVYMLGICITTLANSAANIDYGSLQGESY
jgi:virginiamycin B lyase